MVTAQATAVIEIVSTGYKSILCCSWKWQELTLEFSPNYTYHSPDLAELFLFSSNL